MQCPINNTQDLITGLFIITILLDFTQKTNRFIPEISSFLSSVINLYNLNITNNNNNNIINNSLKTFNQNSFQWLRNALINETNDINDKILWNYFHIIETSTSTSTTNISSSILSVTFLLIEILLQRYENVSCLPELFEIILVNLMELISTNNNNNQTNNETISQNNVNNSNNNVNNNPKFSLLWNNKYNLLIEKIIFKCNIIKTTRKPLTWRPKLKIILETKLPKYETSYKLQKHLNSTSTSTLNNNNSDESKIHLKQLQKQLKRENKAAIREIKRDNEYLEELKYVEKNEKKVSLQNERHKNYNWLEQQQAIINTHVKKFKGELRGGGSGILKKEKRPKREKR